jgi:hypothetical protein
LRLPKLAGLTGEGLLDRPSCSPMAHGPAASR